MGSEEEEEAELICTPTLQLFSNTNTDALIQSPQRSGTVTPPLCTSAAVPFRWEEEPGKPRSCSSFNALSIPKCLELPPRLLDPNVSKLYSPTTVLEGPYGKPRFQSSSFRIVRREAYGSFRRSYNPDRNKLSALVASTEVQDRSLLGSWRWGRKGFRVKREVAGPIYVFPNSSIDYKEVDQDISCRNNVKITGIRQSGSVSRSPFWASVIGSLKQAVPWRNRKQKKDGFVI